MPFINTPSKNLFKLFLLFCILIILLATQLWTVGQKHIAQRLLTLNRPISSFDIHRNKLIHFVRTTLETQLDPLTACAIYSAAIYNSNYSILLHSRSIDLQLPLVLQNISNIQLVSYDDQRMKQLFGGTPLDGWWVDFFLPNDDRLDPRLLSDVMRLLIVYSQGGIYLDTDIITFRSLDEMWCNCMIYESPGLFVNGAFCFLPYHDILWLTMEKIFDQVKRLSDIRPNGPEQITAAFEEYSKIAALDDWKTLETYKMFPVSLNDRHILFNDAERNLDFLNQSIAIHWWSSAHKWDKKTIPDHTLMHRIMEAHCNILL